MTNNRHTVFLDHPSLDLGDLDLSELQLFADTTPQNMLEHVWGAPGGK